MNLGKDNDFVFETDFLKKCAGLVKYMSYKYHLTEYVIYELFQEAKFDYIVKKHRNVYSKDRKDSSYFFGILENKVLSYIKFEKDKTTYLDNKIYVDELIAESVSMLTERMEKFNELVGQILKDDKLPKHCVQIFKKILERLNDGENYHKIFNNELAQELNLTPSYLGNRKSLCIKTVKKLYKDNPIVKQYL